MFSAKQGHYWYHFYNIFGMTLSLTGDWTWDLPPTLEASTLPLGYRRGGPWLGIEPGTSRTRSQHSSTRLSRRHIFEMTTHIRYYIQFTCIFKYLQSAVHVSHDFMGCSTLKKYYAQLQFLHGRFPMMEGGEASIPFTWYDIFYLH